MIAPVEPVPDDPEDPRDAVGEGRVMRLPCRHLLGVPRDASYLTLPITAREHLDGCAEARSGAVESGPVRDLGAPSSPFVRLPVPRVRPDFGSRGPRGP